MSRPPHPVVLVFVAMVAITACTSEPETAVRDTVMTDTTVVSRPEEVTSATAALVALGESGVSGEVAFHRLGDATEIRYSIDGLTPGDHGFHVHKNADCGVDSTEVPGSAAGPHLNPLASPHGAPPAAITGRHAGDLGNVLADASGHAEGIVIDSVLAFRGPTSLLGHAVIVHAGRDDLTTQPSGDAGARVACGITEVRLAPARPKADTVSTASKM